MKKIGLRTLIIAVWLIIIAFILYVPKTTFRKNTLHVFAWGGILDPAVLQDFENQTGITVIASYYSSNEELFVKLKSPEAKNYDLIVPSDYAIGLLIKENLIKPIDHSKLDFLDRINPALLNHPFDPQNQYSLPFAWELLVLGVNLDYLSQNHLPKSWSILFHPNYKVSMTNDPVEAVNFASFYLFGKQTTMLTQDQIELVKSLLMKQRPSVEAYASFMGDYFLSTGCCQVATTSSTYIQRSMNLFSHLGFIIPEEGTFATLENFAIPKDSSKEELTYQLINFLFSKKSIKAHFDAFGFFPAISEGLTSLHPQIDSLLHSSKKDFKKFHFIQEKMTKQELSKLWIELKSS